MRRVGKNPYSHVAIAPFLAATVRMLRKHHILFVVITLTFTGLTLRFWGLNDQYVHMPDSYLGVTGALEILTERRFSYEYLGSVGPAIVLMPFLLFSNSEFTAQIVVGLFGTLITPLSYLFAIKFQGSRLTALLFALAVTFLQFYVSLSRVLLFDIVSLSFTIAFFISLVNALERSSLYFPLACILGYMIFMMKVTFIILVLPVLLLYFARSNSSRLKAGVSLIFLIVGIVSYFFLFPTESSKVLTRAGGTFQVGMHIVDNLRAEVFAILSPLLAPSESVYFASDFTMTYEMMSNWVILLVLVQGLLLFYGWHTFSIKGDRLKLSILSYSIIAAPAFFALYKGWQMRYIATSIFIALFFVCIGVERTIGEIRLLHADRKVRILLNSPRFDRVKIRLRGRQRIYLIKMPRSADISFAITRFFLPICLLTIVVAGNFLASASMVKRWNTSDSLDEQNILIDKAEGQSVVRSAALNKVDVIVSSLAPWLNFYRLQGQLNEVFIFDLFKYAVRNGITEESVDNFVAKIQGYLEDDLKVWYVAGWPEFSYYDADGSLIGNFHQFYDALDDAFLKQELFIFPHGERKSTSYYGPTLRVFNVSKLESKDSSVILECSSLAVDGSMVVRSRRFSDAPEHYLFDVRKWAIYKSMSCSYVS